MSCNQNDRSGNVETTHFFEQCNAVHLRHVDVRDDNVRRKLANLLESFLAIRGQFDPILFFFEGLADSKAGRFLIIDDENTGWISGGRLHDGLEHCWFWRRHSISLTGTKQNSQA